MSTIRESGRHITFMRVEKWDAEQTNWVRRKTGLAEPDAWHFRQLRVRPYECGDHEGNLITDSGWNLLMKNVAGTAGTLFSATVGRIGIGTSTTAAAYTDTALGSVSGMTGNNWKLISSAPTVGGTHSAGLVFAATFGGSDAVGAWQEFGTDQGTASAGPTVTATGVFFNHGISIQGTKASGQTWAVTETITWS